MHTSTPPVALPAPGSLKAIHRDYTTEEAAAILGVKPQTMRAGVCRDGNYMGLRPYHLPNRRLRWDAAAIDAIVIGCAVA